MEVVWAGCRSAGGGGGQVWECWRWWWAGIGVMEVVWAGCRSAGGGGGQVWEC